MKENAALVEYYWQEKTEILKKKSCPTATLYTTIPIQPDL